MGISPLPPVFFWQARYYDFNVWTERKCIEKLRYIHCNPVKRGLCEKPVDWSGAAFVIIFAGLRSSRNRVPMDSNGEQNSLV